MAAYDNTYSRLVAWLKVLLPVAALVLLSTMFLISRGIDPTLALTRAGVDVEGLATTQGITGPQFSGVTSDGAALSFSAESAQPDLRRPGVFSAIRLQAQIETPDGGVVDIRAEKAVVDNEENRLDLLGGVVINTSTNYVIKGEGLQVALDVTWAQSTGPVSATGPLGQINAGLVRLNRQDGPGSTYLLVFNEGVTMVYNPIANEDQ